jgi:hypothetical protein
LPTCLSGGGDQSDVRVCSNDRDKVELLSQTPAPHAEWVLAAGELAIGCQIVVFQYRSVARRSPGPVLCPNGSEVPTPA